MKKSNEYKINTALWIVTSVFMLWYKLSFHELWKDEWQAWFVARDQSLWQMLSFLHYEGHPSMWYLYLKLFTNFKSVIQEDVLIQVAHWLPVMVCYGILFKRFTSPVFLKLALAFSYFMCFEYGVVNRGYVLVVLLSLLSVVLIKENRIKPLAATLFLLCQTEVYGVFIAISFGVYFLFTNYSKEQSLVLLFKKHSLLLMSIFLGFIVFLITVFPRGHKDDFSRAYIGNRFGLENFLHSINGIFGNVFFPSLVPDVGMNGHTPIGLSLSMLSIGILFILFKKDKAVFLSLLSMTTMMIIFSSMVYGGGIRQYGTYFIFFMCLIELRNFQFSKNNFKVYLLSSLLIMPVVHNVRGLLKDARIPFTNAKAAGEYIKKNIDAKIPIVAINKFETAPVIGYAGRPFYELPEGVAFTWFKWLEKVYLPPEAELILFAQYKQSKALYLISPTPIEPAKYPAFKLIKAFDEENFKQESYFLYLKS